MQLESIWPLKSLYNPFSPSQTNMRKLVCAGHLIFTNVRFLHHQFQIYLLLSFFFRIFNHINISGVENEREENISLWV